MLLTKNGESTLIECGAGPESFEYIKQNYHVHNIYLTHHHIDHIWGTHLFPKSTVYINHYDFKKVSDIMKISYADGMYATFDDSHFNEWLKKQKSRQFGNMSVGSRTISVDGFYNMNETLYLSDIKVQFIHAPGHTEGYSIPYLEDYGVLYVGDFDLTKFGPFYNELEGNIDDFIRSARMTLEIDAKYYITGHHKGIYSRKEYIQEMENYLLIIDRREEELLKLIKSGIAAKDIIHQNIFYRQEQLRGSMLREKSEIIGIYKHIERLVNNGEKLQWFLEEFIAEHIAKPDFLDYRSTNT